MDWFKRKKETLKPIDRKEMPDGLWIKCDNCGEIIYKKELEKKLFVCTKCDYHFRIRSKNYIDLLLDDGSFVEFNKQIQSTDPLKFKDAVKSGKDAYDSQCAEASLRKLIAGFYYDERTWGMKEKGHVDYTTRKYVPRNPT